jgi:hypothetical protein
MTPMTLIVTVEPSPVCPNEWGRWRLYSFNPRHTYAMPEVQRQKVRNLPARLKAGRAFVLDCYTHVDTRWALTGEDPQCPWDTARAGGLLLWDGLRAGLPRGRAARAESARAFVRAFNQWLAGEVYRWELTDNGAVVATGGDCFDPAAALDGAREASRGRPIEMGSDLAHTAFEAYTRRSAPEGAAGRG